LVEADAFGDDLLTGSLLAMAYGVEMLALREAAHNAPPAFSRFVCDAIEMAVNAGDIPPDDGALFLNLFGGEPLE
jgi:hypothetical protein